MADYVVDLGKEGGKAGGNIIFPEHRKLVECSDSYTGKYLEAELNA